MTKQELMNYLHQYTPWEMLHLKNLDFVQDIENLNQTLTAPITETEKKTGLHLPYIPDSPENTFSQNLFFSDKEAQDILIIQHDRYTPPTLHKHDFFEFLYVYEGEFVQQISNTKLFMRTGDFCMIPPHVYHSLDVHNYSAVLNLLIHREKFQDIILNHLKTDNVLATFFLNTIYSENRNDYVIFHTNGDMTIQHIILDMCLEFLNKEKYYKHFLNTELLLLFGHLLRSYADTCELPKIKNKKDGLNFAILKYIDNNFRTLSLPELAEHFHYSPQHMSHRVKQLTGMSFTDYILSKRMEIASEFLIKTNMKIKNIGERIGYVNQEHFLRTFRKYYGMTPSAYRMLHQEIHQI